MADVFVRWNSGAQAGARMWKTLVLEEAESLRHLHTRLAVHPPGLGPGLGVLDEAPVIGAVCVTMTALTPAKGATPTCHVCVPHLPGTGALISGRHPPGPGPADCTGGEKFGQQHRASSPGPEASRGPPG